MSALHPGDDDYVSERDNLRAGIELARARIAALEAENARLRSVVLACAAQLDVSTELADRIAALEAEVAALVKAGDAMAECECCPEHSGAWDKLRAASGGKP